MRYIALFLAILCLSQTATAAEQESAYDRILRTGEIRCPYLQWPPYIMKDLNTGKVTGIFSDYMDALGTALDLKIIWTQELNFSTYLQDINAGRIDIECTGGWPTAGRGKYGSYTTPIFYIPLVPFVRVEEARFQDVKDINTNTIKVATIDGENSQFIRQNRFPKTQEVSLVQNSTPSDLFLQITTGKADVTFTDLYSGYLFMDNNPDSIKPIFLDQPVKLIPQNLTLPMGDTKLKDMINTATEELWLDGTIDKILDQYEKYPDSFYRRAKPYQTPTNKK
jgi:ABC-type amino acid transport substrate-binding protein